MNSLWNEFNQKFDVQTITDELRDGSSFEAVPIDTYEVKLVFMALVKSKSEKPMFSARFKILAGKYTNFPIFMNQLAERSFQIKKINEFLDSLESQMFVEFVDFEQYGALIEDVRKIVENKEYALKFGKNERGYNTFEICGNLA
jgi:hypothetical protein